MENLYQTLQCDETADYSDLKKSYSELALKYHPDKGGQQGVNSGEIFSKISKAWTILSDPQLRKEYDIRWRERCLAQAYPIQDSVHFEDFEMLNDLSSDTGEKGGSCKCDISDSAGLEACDSQSEHDHVSDSSCCYGYTCRCGGSYVLTGTDVQMKFDIVCCDSCSLTVQVLYSNSDT